MSRSAGAEPMMDKQQRCSADVHNGGQSVSFHQCLSKGILSYDGERYCKRHYPPTVAAKSEERNQKYEAERAAEEKAETRHRRIHRAERSVLKAAGELLDARIALVAVEKVALRKLAELRKADCEKRLDKAVQSLRATE
jgi:hypothetical protein